MPLKLKSLSPKKEAPKPVGPKEKQIAQKIDTEIKEKIDPDKILQEVAETPENPTGSFGRISENISALINRIKSGEGDVEQAKKVLGRLLQTREDLYKDVAQTINPDIRPVEGIANLYRIAGTEIYGSVISVMDATPALGINRQLAERIKMKLPANSETVSGENLPPKALMEASVVFSGSSAQDRVQHYPGDRDMQEYVRIQASTPEEAASILARGIQESVDQKIEIITPDGEKMTLNFSEMKLGGTYPEDAQLPSGDPKIRWTAQEVKQGYKEYKTKAGEVKRITLEQACLRPDVLKVDYIGVTEDSVMEVTKQTIIQNTSEKGDDSMTNDPGQASAFQEVYFNDPSSFGLIEMTHDPDKFVQYANIMAEQVKTYSKGDHMNGLKVAKRLYNLAKAEGDIALSQEVAQIFGTDAAKVSQLVDRLNVSMLAQKKGIDVSPQQTAITGQLRKLLAGSTSPLSAEALAILDQEGTQEVFDKLRVISASIINSKYQQFLSEHPKVAAKINAILSG